MVRKNVAEILSNHVTFELEAIDRMYLNAYVPSLQTGAGFVYFVKTQLGARVPSTTVVAPMSERFIEAIERFVDTEGIDLVTYRPLTGRYLFEEIIRENLDVGRPDQMQLIFNRRVTRRTPGSFRTRVVTEGVGPSLHVQYKKSKVKQYHKDGQALRTETTINDTYDSRSVVRSTICPRCGRSALRPTDGCYTSNL